MRIFALQGIFFVLLSFRLGADRYNPSPETGGGVPASVLASPTGILCGTVYFEEGNLMPGPLGEKRGGRKPVCRELRLFSPPLSQRSLETEDFQFWTPGPGLKLVPAASVQSDASGTFRIDLPPGTYTLFVVENSRLYANGFDGEGRIQPVEVRVGAETRFDPVINYLATY